jgi:signal transduction histidine kinase
VSDNRTRLLERVDECVGLPAEVERTMFVPFTQGAGDARGLGLGLPIAREAMEAQGGRLSVTNLEGKGCILRIELPGEPNGAQA